MAWLVGILVTVAIIWLMVVSPGFRSAVILIVVVVGGGIALWVHSENKKWEKGQAEQAQAEILAASRVGESDLDFDSVTLTKEYSTWYLRGNVKNRSKYTLRTIRLKIILEECAVRSACVTVGDQEASAHFEGIPPGQMRNFSTSVPFTNLPSLKQAKWSYSLIGTRAW
jgi:hypothetical protein